MSTLQVTDRLMATARRLVVETVAHLYLNEQIDEADAARRLRGLTSLPEVQAWAAFEDLCQALQHRQDVADGDITVFEVEADLAHPDVLGEKAEQGVVEALDALVHGGTLRAVLKAEALARVPLTTPERTAS